MLCTVVGNTFDERFRVERPIQAHLQHTHFLILRIEKIDCFVDRLATRAH